MSSTTVQTPTQLELAITRNGVSKHHEEFHVFTGMDMRRAAKAVRTDIAWMLKHQNEYTYVGPNTITVDGATQPLKSKALSTHWEIDLGKNRKVFIHVEETGSYYSTAVRIYDNSGVTGNYKGGPADPSNPRRLTWGKAVLRHYLQISPCFDCDRTLAVWEGGSPAEPGIPFRKGHQDAIALVWVKVLKACQDWQLDDSC